jgi:hypothetical protein
MVKVVVKDKEGNARVTTDGNALLQLMNRYPKHKQLLTAISDIKSLNHRMSNDILTEIDEDNRVRGSYSMGPETGRLSCKKNSRGTGRNMQNFER